MNKFPYYALIAYLVFMIAAALLYMPASNTEQLTDINVVNNDGVVNISGKMAEGYKYRGYSVNVMAGTYFVTIRRGLIGKSDFSFDVDETKIYRGSKAPEKLIRIYLMESNGQSALLYEPQA